MSHPEPAAPFSLLGTYAPPTDAPRFRTVKQVLTCEYRLPSGDACGREFSYKHGRPPKYCPEHRTTGGQAARARYTEVVRAEPAPVTPAIATADPVPPAAVIDARLVAFQAAQLTPALVVEFLRRDGVAVMTFTLGTKVFVGQRMYEGDTVELAIAAALIGEVP